MTTRSRKTSGGKSSRNASGRGTDRSRSKSTKASSRGGRQQESQYMDDRSYNARSQDQGYEDRDRSYRGREDYPDGERNYGSGMRGRRLIQGRQSYDDNNNDRNFRVDRSARSNQSRFENNGTSNDYRYSGDGGYGRRDDDSRETYRSRGRDEDSRRTRNDGQFMDDDRYYRSGNLQGGTERFSLAGNEDEDYDMEGAILIYEEDDVNSDQGRSFGAQSRGDRGEYGGTPQRRSQDSRTRSDRF